MPPRIVPRATASSLGPLTESLSLLSFTSSSTQTPVLSTRPPPPSLPRHSQRPGFPPPSSRRPFSVTAPAPGRKHRERFREWLKKNNKLYKRPEVTNYLGRKKGAAPGEILYPESPFQLNPYFKSLNVLGEDARELIWEKVMRKGESIKAVSADLGVDIRRVAAVVRLKEVEKDWIAKKKPLALPYAKAVLDMLPVKDYRDDTRGLEPINEISMHPWTQQQLFIPVSESRQFTREDAAKAFGRKMLSADERMPHPELVQKEREIHVDGVAPILADAKFREAAAQSELRVAQGIARKAAAEERETLHVKGPRAEFRFRNVNAEDCGPRGRSQKAPGWRYGVTHYDRKKGEVKIPTSVE